jgi:micrococcal nuclease
MFRTLKTRWRSLFRGWSWLAVAAIASLAVLVSCQTPPPAGVRVQVEQVISGQVLEVRHPDGAGGKIERVRLIGIDAPDLAQQPWGPAAKRQLEQLVTNKTISLELGEEAQDRFDRTLGYVWLGNGKLLNEQLVKQGYALAVPRSPNIKYDKRLGRAQEQARLMGVGIWNPQEPMRQTPAEFRSQNR